MRSPWLIQVSPKSSDKCLYKRRRDIKEKVTGRDWAAETGVLQPRMPGEAGGGGEHSPCSLREECGPNTTSSSDFWSPELFQAMTFVVICDNSPRKLLQALKTTRRIGWMLEGLRFSKARSLQGGGDKEPLTGTMQRALFLC